MNALRKGKKLRPASHRKHFYPEPRIAVGQYLREKKLASAMIDISDGLSTDLSHICEESKTGAVVYAGSLPAVAGEDGLALALHGGDEYELLFTAAPKRQVPKEIAGVPVSLIGEIVGGKQVQLATVGWENGNPEAGRLAAFRLGFAQTITAHPQQVHSSQGSVRHPSPWFLR